MLNKLERKLGRIKWPSFMLILLIVYVIGYISYFIYKDLLAWICFSPAHIFKGQVWRVLTFVANPLVARDAVPSPFSVILQVFIYFSISRSLERVVGRFKVNFFLVTGWLFTLLAGFLYYLFFRSSNLILYLKMNYVFTTLFIVFSMIYPDATFLLMFFIPIKGKWMSLITLGFFALDIIPAFMAHNFESGWLYLFMIVAAVLNVVLFLFLMGYRFKKPAKSQTQRHYQNEVKGGSRNAYREQGTPYGQSSQNNAGASREMRYGGYQRTASGARTLQPYRHKCCVCGRTDVSDPDLEFRYCSKCIGPYEYCSEHIYTHVHRRPSGTEND